MNIYYAATYYHVLCAITHRLFCAPEDRAHIIVSDSRSYHQAMCVRLKDTDLFDGVTYFEEHDIVAKCSSLYKKQGCKGSIASIEAMSCREIEKRLPFPITDEHNYYLCTDFKAFAIYFRKKKIPYYYFEDGAGILSREESLLVLLKSPFTHRVIEEYGLNGKNDLVIGKYANVNAQVEGFYDEKIIDFRVKDLMEQLNREDIDKILYVFGAERIKSSEKKSALVLTQPFILRSHFSFMKHRKTYASLMDYYCEEMDIYIKPHPTDLNSTYSKWFSDVKIIEPQVPSELISLCTDQKFDLGISISSTAVYSLGESIDQIICFDSDADREVEVLHIYYAVMRVLERISVDEKIIYTDTMHHGLLQSMIAQQSSAGDDIAELGYICDTETTEVTERKHAFLPGTVTRTVTESQITHSYLSDTRQRILIFNATVITEDILAGIREHDIIICRNCLYDGELEKQGYYLKGVKTELSDHTKSVNQTRKGGILVYAKEEAVIADVVNLGETKELIHSELTLQLTGYDAVPDEMKDILVDLYRKECGRLKKEYESGLKTGRRKKQMNEVRLLDCTLRDGGYINDWHFGQPTIKKIIRHLNRANIDIIECGFITGKEYDKDYSLYHNADDVSAVIEAEDPDCLYVAMIAMGEKEIDPQLLCDRSESCIGGIRLTFHEYEIEKAFEYGRTIMKKGYKLFMQPVGTALYSDLQLLELIEKINGLSPYAFYLVDTLGTLQPEETERLIGLIDHNLRAGICLGFHSHNNLQLSFSDAQIMAEYKTQRELIIDCSVFGMGRGAGNLCTEMICEYLNDNRRHRYDLIPLMETIDEELMPIYAKSVWGYSAGYFLAAINQCHPNYATYLLSRQTIRVRTISKLLEQIPRSERGLFNKKLIEQIYSDYQKNAIDDAESMQKLAELLKGREILILASGPSIAQRKADIQTFIEEKSPFIISVNFIPDDFAVDMMFISDQKRYAELKNKSEEILMVATSNIDTAGDGLLVNYSDLLVASEGVADNSGLMLIQLLNNLAVRQVTLAGFDGFHKNLSQNYVYDRMIGTAEAEHLDEKNRLIRVELQKLGEKIKIGFLTASKYQ